MMLLNKQSMGVRLVWLVFILMSVQMVQSLDTFSDVPPPPVRPERFHSREELKRYLQLVHEYYSIIGRPRFGRSEPEIEPSLNGRRYFGSWDVNNDKPIIYDEDYKRFETD